MKLNEKIYQCRRKAGLSQEALAERIGVSRQAISKWETGEASPEISKLPLLARTFGVTADWLLSEDEESADESQTEEAPAQQDAAPHAAQSIPNVRSVPDWVDKLPGFLARMIRMYGWIVGVRMAVGGALFTAMGFVAKAMFGSMNSYANQQMSSMGGLFGGSSFTVYDSAGNVIDPGSIGLSASDFGISSSPFDISVSAGMSDPFGIFCNFIIIIGLVLLVGGVWLAWYLKKKGSES